MSGSGPLATQAGDSRVGRLETLQQQVSFGLELSLGAGTFVGHRGQLGVMPDSPTNHERGKGPTGQQEHDCQGHDNQTHHQGPDHQSQEMQPGLCLESEHRQAGQSRHCRTWKLLFHGLTRTSTLNGPGYL
jgi:hypothetical protein